MQSDSAAAAVTGNKILRKMDSWGSRASAPNSPQGTYNSRLTMVSRRDGGIHSRRRGNPPWTPSSSRPQSQSNGYREALSTSATQPANSQACNRRMPGSRAAVPGIMDL